MFHYFAQVYEQRREDLRREAERHWLAQIAAQDSQPAGLLMMIRERISSLRVQPRTDAQSSHKTMYVSEAHPVNPS